MPVIATSFGRSLFARHAVSTPYHTIDSRGLEGPLNRSAAGDLRSLVFVAIKFLLRSCF